MNPTVIRLWTLQTLIMGYLSIQLLLEYEPKIVDPAAKPEEKVSLKHEKPLGEHDFSHFQQEGAETPTQESAQEKKKK